MSAIVSKIDERNVLTLTLNRPLIHNAFDDTVIRELSEALRDVETKTQVRAVMLTAVGPSFSAGADLHWMRRMANYSVDENVSDAVGLASLMRRLDSLPKPTMALVQGAAFGGGVGLVAACDIAIASETATFSLSEVRLGLIPAVISPYVIKAIGARAARRYFLTGEKFSAAEALRIGLLHEVTTPDHLIRVADKIMAQLLEGGPRAQVESKRLIEDIAGKPIDVSLTDETARRIAAIRASQEGREGITAFLEKRKPSWIK
ncbi:MAG: enoyl-CoA hydratase/isomerase family protein [Dongiaceae bacterium]